MYRESFTFEQDNLIDDTADLDRREPMAGTSRMMNLEPQNLISDDSFGESGFGRKCSMATSIYICSFVVDWIKSKCILFIILRRASGWLIRR